MQDSAITIDAIDFLPAHYREEGAKQRTQLWRLLVVSAIGAMIAAASLFQAHLERRAEAQLVVVENEHVQAVTQTTQLVELQTKLAPARTTAELLTYLRHRWPRTQILAATLTGLPSQVTLSEMHIVRENPPLSAQAVATSQTLNDPTKQPKLPPSETDLARLRAENDSSLWILNVKGITYEPAALHEYLAHLGHNRLFKKVELRSIATSAEQSSASQFTVRLTLRTAYGLPDGPNPVDLATAQGASTAAKEPGYAR